MLLIESELIMSVNGATATRVLSIDTLAAKDGPALPVCVAGPIVLDGGLSYLMP